MLDKLLVVPMDDFFGDEVMELFLTRTVALNWNIWCCYECLSKGV